ncbi:squalene synthase HpnC [Acidocella aminolytica]|jgi:farnesyl-diphosphate farnesyltransferase|uniref:Phytoene/squalene synthase n=1 Tax=Acidocella aminolytica 101 = DSM 11237 TaxID=1120923 RepID=A0A0D6PEN9_9PROT|nr:squalene synthase HpnC [Acidocella aminolytica]GAN80127.1 phytoene/squalene synthase [Acidocella aminolytica 101 = DSM 11237]GBQ38059.1 phytoene synthase [Acidocella aminolytica 101 = DSM 11237]SHE87309.1 farnesyl-diphosphate farnesyltransferase [Acidocella aminolytica 101 = DSM 11237]
MIANDNTAPTRAKGRKSVEAWSGKDKGDENFPVASLLIAKPLRARVHAYYDFARNADDISDSPTLSPEEKLARLNAMEAVLTGAEETGSASATKLRRSLAESGVPAAHARELLVAFRQDVIKTRYENWAELLHYCRYSAAPVGRYVLDVHGESLDTWGPSDALCASLQVLNHLQDCAKDLRDLDRCYVPQDWLHEAGLSTDDIARPETTPALRAVFDKMLDATQDLNRTAADLPKRVKSRRLRIETAIICALANRLTVLLRHGDPLATRIKLSKLDVLTASLKGLKYAP